MLAGERRHRCFDLTVGTKHERRTEPEDVFHHFVYGETSRHAQTSGHQHLEVSLAVMGHGWHLSVLL